MLGAVRRRVPTMDRRNASAALPFLIGGGLLIGTLDLLFALAFWAPRGATLPAASCVGSRPAGTARAAARWASPAPWSARFPTT